MRDHDLERVYTPAAIWLRFLVETMAPSVQSVVFALYEEFWELPFFPGPEHDLSTLDPVLTTFAAKKSGTNTVTFAQRPSLSILHELPNIFPLLHESGAMRLETQDLLGPPGDVSTVPARRACNHANLSFFEHPEFDFRIMREMEELDAVNEENTSDSG